MLHPVAGPTLCCISGLIASYSCSPLPAGDAQVLSIVQLPVSPGKRAYTVHYWRRTQYTIAARHPVILVPGLHELQLCKYDRKEDCSCERIL